MVSPHCPCCGGAVAPSAVIVNLDQNVIVLGWVDTPINVTACEAEFVHILAKASPRVVRYGLIIEQMWGAAEPEDAMNCIKVHKFRIGKKIGHLGVLIENVKDRGYRMVINREGPHVQ